MLNYFLSINFLILIIFTIFIAKVFISTLREPSLNRKDLREPSLNRKDLWALTSVGPTKYNPVLDPQADYVSADSHTINKWCCNPTNLIQIINRKEPINNFRKLIEALKEVVLKI